MISEAGLASKMLGGLIKYFKVEYITNREKANSYVSEVLTHVKAVIDSDEINDKQIDYSHEMVKKLYASVSTNVGEIISSNDLSKIRQALAAARVFYWVRKYNGKPGEEIIDIIKDRIKRIHRGEVRHNSNEYIIKKILDLNTKTPRLVEHEIELIQANCFADIAELEELHMSVIKSKVRKW